MYSDVGFILSSGREIPVLIEEKNVLRNVILRPKNLNGNWILCISKPKIVSDKYVLNFLESKRKWVERFFEKIPEKKPLKPGDIIIFLDRSVRVIQDSAVRDNRYLDTDKTTLLIGGKPDMFERRVRDFIKDEFLTNVREIIKTTPKEYWPKRIALRDTTSRWGSCSSTGTISFSWRLAFAPGPVMRYVIMHELAHRQYMDHSAEFWKTVSKLYGFGVERAKIWLKKNGNSLHTYF